jgi:predicted permease
MSWLNDLGSDTSLALRGMRKSLAFSVAVIALIGLGAGANTAIFSALDRTLIHPIPVPDGDRMVKIRASADEGKRMLPTSVDMIDAWRAKGRAVEDVLLSRGSSAVLGDTAAFPIVTVATTSIQPGAMHFMGTRPLLGREIQGADTLPSAPSVVVLGYNTWRGQFGGNDAVIGKQIRLDGKPYTVIGIAPREFFVPFADPADVFTPLMAGAAKVSANIVVKLRPGVLLASATQELRTFAPRPISGPKAKPDLPRLVEGREIVSGSDRKVILAMFVVVSLVLLITCANIANLMLTRALARYRDFAVRRALGATQSRLVRQMLAEAAVFAVAGGAVALAVAMVIQRLLVHWQPVDNRLLPSVLPLDFAVFGWTFGCAIVTGVLAGIAPALLASSNRGTAGTGVFMSRSAAGSSFGRNLRDVLVVGQVAVSVTLLVGAGLFVRTLWSFQHADRGFQQKNLLALVVRLPGAQLADSTARLAALTSVRQRIEAVPGVISTTLSTSVPPAFAVIPGAPEIEGRASGHDSLQTVLLNTVASDFFEKLQIPVVTGRPFKPNESLNPLVEPSEVMISLPLARKLFGGATQAIGRRMRLYGRTQWATVAGVVRDIGINNELRSYQVYEPIWPAPLSVAIDVRASIPPGALELPLRQAVRDAAPGSWVHRFVDVEAQAYAAQALHRFVLALIGCFAVLAAIVAGFGLHAVISYGVQQRRREIGIRAALGASSAGIVRLIARQALALGFLGALIGVIGALTASRLIAGLLYGVRPSDPLTLSVVVLTSIVGTLVAAAAPARRASAVDPMEALRTE